MLFTFSLCMTLSCSAQTLNKANKFIEKDTQVVADSVSSHRNFTCRTVRTDAEFENGSDNWEAYLQENVNFDLPKQKGCPAGTYTVRINFVISKEGAVTQTKATTTYGFGMENEVIRVLSLSPKWKAATQNGRIVKAYQFQLITFEVCESAKAEIIT